MSWGVRPFTGWYGYKPLLLVPLTLRAPLFLYCNKDLWTDADVYQCTVETFRDPEVNEEA
jgi:hypothetical protein